MSTKQRTTPCRDCPFRRDVKPGTLGGSTSTVYVGQSIGPFVLNCHRAEGYEEMLTTGKCLDVEQCAGAAIYRANLGVDDRLPSRLLRLPADSELVFDSHVEFVAHHEQVTTEMAIAYLAVYPPRIWLSEQLNHLKTTRVP